MYDYLKTIFQTAGMVSNIGICFGAFLITALTWSFSFGHRFWGLCVTLSMILFTIILHYAPAQYLWFRPIPGISLSVWMIYNFYFFYPYARAIFEYIKRIRAKAKPTFLRNNLFIRPFTDYAQIPVWIVPALAALIGVILVGVSFVQKTEAIATQSQIETQAKRENTRAVRQLTARQQAFEDSIKNELVDLRIENDSLFDIINNKATIATKEAVAAKKQAQTRYNANKSRIDKLERDRSRFPVPPVQKKNASFRLPADLSAGMSPLDSTLSAQADSVSYWVNEKSQEIDY